MPRLFALGVVFCLATLARRDVEQADQSREIDAPR